MEPGTFCLLSGSCSASWGEVSAQPLQLHHVGNRTVRFLSPSGLVRTVSAPGEGLSPFGVELESRGTFEEVAGAARLAGAAGLVIFTQQLRRVDLTLHPHEVDPMALAALDRRAQTAAARWQPEHRQLHDLGRALAGALLDGAPLEDLALALVGAGPGATPAGDDILIGLYAGLSLTDHPNLSARLTTAVSPLLERTTVVSRTLLVAAAAGEFASFVHELARAAGDPRHIQSAFDTAQAVGASSGLDTAIGLLATQHPHTRKYAA